MAPPAMPCQSPDPLQIVRKSARYARRIPDNTRRRTASISDQRLAGKTTLFTNQITETWSDLGQTSCSAEDRVTPLVPINARIAPVATYQSSAVLCRTPLEHNVTALGLMGPSLGHAGIPSAPSPSMATLRRNPAPPRNWPRPRKNFASHPVSEIAYGEKRPCRTGMALCAKPMLRLLDEPLRVTVAFGAKTTVRSP